MIELDDLESCIRCARIDGAVDVIVDCYETISFVDKDGKEVGFVDEESHYVTRK